MSTTANVQVSRTEKEAREQLKLQIGAYLAQQPGSTQALHRWMKRLEVVGLGITLAIFLMALYVSFAWKSTPGNLIAVAWFVFAASAGLPMALVGIHTLLLKAFPPVVLPSKPQRFVTGSAAVLPGVGFILMALAISLFWGYFAYTVGTFNLAMLEPLTRILGTAVSAVIVIGILLSIAQKIVKFR